MSGLSTPRYVYHRLDALKEVTRDSNAEEFYRQSLVRFAAALATTITNTSKSDHSEYFVPFRLVLEHYFAEETNGRHAVIEQFVMELLQ